jgi:hypothetical protein
MRMHVEAGKQVGCGTFPKPDDVEIWKAEKLSHLPPTRVLIIIKKG